MSVLLWTTFLSACLVNTCSSNSEEQIRYLWNWAYTLKSQMYWVSAVLNWVFLKFMLANTTFPLYVLYITNYLHWVFIISFAFYYSWFQKQLGIPEKWLGKYPTKQLICFSGNCWKTFRKPFTFIHLHVLWSTDIWGASKPLNKH